MVKTLTDDGRPICYAYGRHSTIKQEYTRLAQRAKLKDYWRANLKRKGVRWGGFYYDKAMTGASEFGERPKGREVYALAKPGDYIIVTRLDRPFRSVADGVRIIQAFNDRKVKFLSLDLPISSEGLMGKFFFTILLAVAELERGFASERTKEVNAYRKKMGLTHSRNSPMGWKIIGRRAAENENKRSTRRFVVDFEERALCERIYEQRQEGMSIEQLALWCWRQKEFQTKRPLDNYKAVEWVIAAKELDYPKIVSGRDVVKMWRRAKRQEVL